MEWDVEVTGCTWQLRGLLGLPGSQNENFQEYVLIFFLPRRPRNYHEIVTTHSILRKLPFVALSGHL